MSGGGGALDLMEYLDFLIGGVAWTIARSQRGPSRTPSPSEPRETPLETLQRRYAEGVLSTEEYRERKERLERDLSP